MSEFARAKLADNGTAPGRRVHFNCPGCIDVHGVVVDTPSGWGWNGSLTLPTFTPSIYVHSHKTVDDEGNVGNTPNCHSYVTDGRIQFLNDCTHTLAGQIVDLPPWESADASDDKDNTDG